MKAKLCSLLLVALSATSTTLSTRAKACAGCRNPALAVTRGSEGPLSPSAWRLGAAITGTTIHVVHEAGCRDLDNCEEVPVQPTYQHDQNIYPVELRVSAEYGFSKTFGLELQLPARAVTTRIEYTDASGAPYEPLDPEVHHRDETVTGLADPWLLLRIGTTLDKWWLAARPGVSIPLGHTQENPFALGDRGERHQHIQLGTGTFDPIAVVEASRSFDELSLQLFAQGQVPFYENTHGYRAPWRVYGGVSLGRKLFGDLVGSLGVEASHEAEERWDGEVRQDGNLGRTELLGSASLTQTFGRTELGLNVRVPFYRHIVVGDEPPGTLSSPVVLSLSVAHVFGGPEPDHEH